MISLRYIALAAYLLLPASASAQQAAKSATATVRVTAFVAPVLRIETITPWEATPVESGAISGSIVSARANVEHRVLVRPARGAVVALRGPTGGWVTASASAPLQFTGGLGDVTHRIECRGAMEACMLTFELVSSDSQFPMRATSSMGRVAGGATLTSVATSS